MSRFNIRHVVLIALTGAFMYYGIIANLGKFSKNNTVVVESMKRISEVTYPSFTMCPWYVERFAWSKFSRSKNLTEYYESLLNAKQIERDIISIWPPYIPENE